MIDYDKPVQTRDGRAVTVLTTLRADTMYPVVALVEDKDIVIYTDLGKIHIGRDWDDDLDLVNVPEKHKVSFWVNCNSDGITYKHDNRERADWCASLNRIACIPVTIEFEEGEGL